MFLPTTPPQARRHQRTHTSILLTLQLGRKGQTERREGGASEGKASSRRKPGPPIGGEKDPRHSQGLLSFAPSAGAPLPLPSPLWPSPLPRSPLLCCPLPTPATDDKDKRGSCEAPSRSRRGKERADSGTQHNSHSRNKADLFSLPCCDPLLRYIPYTDSVKLLLILQSQWLFLQNFGFAILVHVILLILSHITPFVHTARRGIVVCVRYSPYFFLPIVCAL